MPTFRVKSECTVTYQHEVEADTHEEAIDMVENDEADDLTEIDSTGFTAIAYTIPGQMGWNELQEAQTLDLAEQHQLEQDRITAECEAGECDHPECHESDSDDTDTDYMSEIVARVAPRWAWDAIDAVLGMAPADPRPGVDVDQDGDLIIEGPEGGNMVHAMWMAQQAMAQACEAADEEPVRQTDITPTKCMPGGGSTILGMWTIWISQADGQGTHHVSTYLAATVEEAKQEAIQQAAADWGWTVERDPNQISEFAPCQLHVLGVAKGAVVIDEWSEPSTAW